MYMATLHITQHIRYRLMPSLPGTLLPSVATPYMLGTLFEIVRDEVKYEKYLMMR